MLFWKKILWFLGLTFFLVTLALLSVMYHFYDHINSPASGASGSVLLTIPKGTSFKTVRGNLGKEGVITNPLYFDLLARLTKKRGSLKAGDYALDKGMTPIEVLEIITEGRSIQYALTVPEGFNVKEIGTRLELMKEGSALEFNKLARSREILDYYGIPGDSLEGYLFPDTYHFSKGTGELAIITKMADHFNQKVKTREIMEKIERSGLSFHETITLASLIEKETALEKEKSLIAAVFHNRLKKRMLLQCDPTVIYAMENFDGNIRKKDLKIDSPYNTYRYRGLPPGPIANPGLESILAVLNPSNEKFLYFVSRKDGSHYFSSSLEEHNRAVRKYQLRRKR